MTDKMTDAEKHLQRVLATRPLNENEVYEAILQFIREAQQIAADAATAAERKRCAEIAREMFDDIPDCITGGAIAEAIENPET